MPERIKCQKVYQLPKCTKCPDELYAQMSQTPKLIKMSTWTKLQGEQNFQMSELPKWPNAQVNQMPKWTNAQTNQMPKWTNYPNESNAQMNQRPKWAKCPNEFDAFLTIQIFSWLPVRLCIWAQFPALRRIQHHTIHIITLSQPLCNQDFIIIIALI